MTQVIDLRSDTITKPSREMLLAAMSAEVGDDCYGEDPTVKKLENYCAELFKKEMAMFMPTGTMSNQIAVASLTNQGDEVICDASYHINFFESSQTAVLCKVALNTIHTDNGVITVKDLEAAIDRKARFGDLYAQPKLLLLENSISTHGGKVFPLKVLSELKQYCDAKSIKVYMDGARLLNACTAKKIEPSEYAKHVDGLSICFAKGLSAPFGSVLIGPKEMFSKAKKLRKWFGGALHQSGYMAAMALYALKNNMSLLEEDNKNASLFSTYLIKINALSLFPTETNFVMFDVTRLGVTADHFVNEARKNHLLMLAWQERIVRVVFHNGISQEDVIRAAGIVSNICNEILKRKKA